MPLRGSTSPFSCHPALFSKRMSSARRSVQSHHVPPHAVKQSWTLAYHLMRSCSAYAPIVQVHCILASTRIAGIILYPANSPLKQGNERDRWHIDRVARKGPPPPRCIFHVTQRPTDSLSLAWAATPNSRVINWHQRRRDEAPDWG